MGDEAMDKKVGAHEIENRSGRCRITGQHGERKKKIICEMSDLPSIFGSQQGNSIAQKLVRILHDKRFELF